MSQTFPNFFKPIETNFKQCFHIFFSFLSGQPSETCFSSLVFFSYIQIFQTNFVSMYCLGFESYGRNDLPNSQKNRNWNQYYQSLLYGEVQEYVEISIMHFTTTAMPQVLFIKVDFTLGSLKSSYVVSNCTQHSKQLPLVRVLSMYLSTRQFRIMILLQLQSEARSSFINRFFSSFSF